MTAPVRPQSIAIDPVDVFIARAEARAILWREGALTLHAAIDELWADAERAGLVAKLGADHVQQILADAFAPVRDDLPCNQEDIIPDEVAADEPTTTTVAASTLDAAEYLIQQKDPNRLRTWLAEHLAEERAAILKHLERKARRK